MVAGVKQLNVNLFQMRVMEDYSIFQEMYKLTAKLIQSTTLHTSTEVILIDCCLSSRVQTAVW